MKLSLTSLDYLNSDSKVGEIETLTSILGSDDMDVDNDSYTPNSSSGFESMEVDYDDDSITSHNLISKVAARVHSALLDSGFVGFDPVSSTKLDLFHPPDINFLTSSSSPLHYTIPRVLSSNNIILQTVSVKFQSVEKSVDIIGSLKTNNDEFIYKTKWFESQTDWKKAVKDEIALPLLVDLCESVGLVPPACFMMLHSDLKIKILELLPGTDIARVGRVCAELRSIVSSNDRLWRRKFEQEFPNRVEWTMGTKRSWKEEFASAWRYTITFRNPIWRTFTTNSHYRGRDIWRHNLLFS